MASTDLTPIPLTQDDIHLITFALRRLSETTGFATQQAQCKDLIQYVERENASRPRTIGELEAEEKI